MTVASWDQPSAHSWSICYLSFLLSARIWSFLCMGCVATIPLTPGATGHCSSSSTEYCHISYYKSATRLHFQHFTLGSWDAKLRKISSTADTHSARYAEGTMKLIYRGIQAHVTEMRKTILHKHRVYLPWVWNLSTVTVSTSRWPQWHSKTLFTNRKRCWQFTNHTKLDHLPTTTASRRFRATTRNSTSPFQWNGMYSIFKKLTLGTPSESELCLF